MPGCGALAARHSSKILKKPLRGGVIWSDNLGALGNGSSESSNVPVNVVGLDDAVEVAGSHYSTCARRRNGHVICWGSNNLGELGIGESGPTRFVPTTEVVGLTDAVQLSAGPRYFIHSRWL